MAEQKIKYAIKKGLLPRKKIYELASLSLEKQVITKDEYQDLLSAEQLRTEIIQVDSFSEVEFLGHTKRPTMAPDTI